HEGVVVLDVEDAADGQEDVVLAHLDLFVASKVARAPAPTALTVAVAVTAAVAPPTSALLVLVVAVLLTALVLLSVLAPLLAVALAVLGRGGTPRAACATIARDGPDGLCGARRAIVLGLVAVPSGLARRTVTARARPVRDLEVVERRPRR